MSPPLEGVRPKEPLFEGGCPEAPILGKHAPHTGETYPPASPHVYPKGGRGETFPQDGGRTPPPRPGCVGNVGACTPP
jgi:hypothetical protein